MRHCNNALNQDEINYKLCTEQLRIIIKLTQKLISEKTRELVEYDFKEYLNGLSTRKNLDAWIKDIQKQSNSWMKGLFVKNEHNFIPKTNNGIEQYIKSLKADFVKILNRPFIHRIFLRKSEFWVFAREINDPSIAIIKLKECTLGDLKKSKSRFGELAQNFRIERLCAKNFDKELEINL